MHGHSTQHSRLGVQGSTGIGVVTSVGSDVTNIKANDAVYLYSNNGTWANATTTSSNQVSKTSVDAASAGTFHLALTSWAILNKVPLTASSTVMADTLATPIGSVLKQVAKEMKINIQEFDAKKESKADLMICTNSTAKELLRSVAKSGTLLLCNTAAPVQVPYSASIFNDLRA